MEGGLISEALALPLPIPGDLAAHVCDVSAGWWAATRGDGSAILNVLPAAEQGAILCDQEAGRERKWGNWWTEDSPPLRPTPGPSMSKMLPGGTGELPPS